MKTRNWKRFYSVVFLWLLVLSTAFSQEFTRCWRSSIIGFEAQHTRAESIIQPANSRLYADESLKNLKLFVAAKKIAGSSETALYIHTNFKPTGQENALKLAFPSSTLQFAFKDGDYDLSSLVANVLGGEGVASAESKIARNATVYVDPSAFELFPRIKAGDVKIKQITPPGSISRPFLELVDATGGLKRITQISPPPPEARLYLSASLAANPARFEALRNYRFEKNDVTLLSFVQDKATTDYLTTTLNETRAPRISENTPVAKFAEMLKLQKGKCAFILGHIENGQFYLSKDGSIKIALTEIERIGKENGVTVAIVGCASGVSESGVVASKYINSLVAAKRFVQAMESPNYLEFFERLSSSDLEVVVNEQLVNRLSDGSQFLTSRGTLYSKGISSENRLRQPDGTITLSGKLIGGQ